MSQISWASPSVSSLVITPCSTSWAAKTSRTGVFFLISAAISGCVYAGSSVSLWPKRR